MKRRELVRIVAAEARARGMVWQMIREGAEHEVWSLDGRRITIPRHREIGERTARAILRSFEAEFGERWWER